MLFCEMLKDLEKKNYLRSDIIRRKEQAPFTNVMLNVQKISKAFNVWFDVYVDRRKPDSKQKLKRIMEIGEITDEDVVYFIFSDMIFVFLQNIEEFRSAFLYILKLPILKKNGKKRIIHNTSLRNGLSHGLFWFEMKDYDCSQLHLHYSEDVELSKISSPISITELFLKTRKQSLITNCLLNVIADWFENTA